MRGAQAEFPLISIEWGFTKWPSGFWMLLAVEVPWRDFWYVVDLVAASVGLHSFSLSVAHSVDVDVNVDVDIVVDVRSLALFVG